MRAVRSLPSGWEAEIQRILGTVGEDWDDTSSAANSNAPSSPNRVAIETLKLGLQLALKERDTIMRQFETLAANGNIQIPAHAHSYSYHAGMMPTQREMEDLTLSSPKLNNRESELNTARGWAEGQKPMPSPKLAAGALNEMLIEPVDEEDEEQTTWEYHSVQLARVAGYGFGIAVSGGRDNPHFRNGDPSIAVSDVLRSGPAWGQLLINDRVVSANGASLENADYATAVQIMKDSDALGLIVKRRVPIPALELEQRTLKFTLSKSKRKEDFGIELGCRFYVKGISNPKLAEKDPGLREGDSVLRINGLDCRDMSFEDAQRHLHKSRERLSLVIQRDVAKGSSWKWPSQQTLYERLGSVSLAETPRESPRASPMPPHRLLHSDYADRAALHLLNNARAPPRGHPLSPQTGAHQSRAEYGPNRLSGSGPPSRSRTPSQNNYEPDYAAFAPAQASTSFGMPTPELQQRLSSPAEEESAYASKPPLPSELRRVVFRKEGGSVGVRVIGGNEVGIFVSAVQANSPAALKGVRPGDKLLQVNKRDMRGVTREEAVQFLLGLQDIVELTLQFRKDEYERIRAQNLGDHFFIRAHFDYSAPEQDGEMRFRRGDILQVTDTLFGGTVGAWQASKVSSPSASLPASPTDPASKGLIPNAARAEKLAALADPLTSSTGSGGTLGRASRSSTSTGGGGGTFLRKKMGLARRAKSLTKGHWDEVVFAQGALDTPAYERVKLKHPGVLRPVVLFGPLADMGREMLLKDFPLRFSAARGEGAPEDPAAAPGIVRLSAIKEVMEKRKHAVLDVTPSSVEKLQYAQYCPIVIFLGVESRKRLKEMRTRHSKAAAAKSTRKLMEQATRIQKEYPHLFTATLDATKEDGWFEALRELIGHLQERRVWMSETRPGDLLEDDFLFPMAPNAMNYAHDSDLDSQKGDSEIASPRKVPPQNGDYAARSNAPYSDYVTRQSEYEPRASLVPHFATIRRMPQLQRPRVPPAPPPRAPACPPALPPKPPPTSPTPRTTTTSPPRRSASLSEKAESALLGEVLAALPAAPWRVERAASSLPASPLRKAAPELPDACEPGPMANSAGSRHLSEPGYYDVKQILAEQAEDYRLRRRSPSPYGPQGQPGMMRPPRPPYAQQYEHAMRAGPVPPGYGMRPFASPQVPRARPGMTLMNPAYLPPNSAHHPPPPFAHYANGGAYAQPRASLVSRASSMPSNGAGIVAPHQRRPPPPAPAASRAPGRDSTEPSSTPMESSSSQQSELSTTESLRREESGEESRTPTRDSPPKPAATAVPVRVESWTPATTNGDHRRREEEVPIPPSPSVTTSSASAFAAYSPKATPPPTNGGPDASTKLLLPPRINGASKLASPEPDPDLGQSAEEKSHSSGEEEEEESEEDGHTVVAHVVGVIGAEGGVLSSDETGVSIHIPPGALPSASQQEIYFKVCKDTRMAPPLDTSKGETLLSPLVMCGPQGLRFARPVELRLPHCAAGISSEQWSFALKSASGSEAEWKQVSLAEEGDADAARQKGRLEENFVSVMIDHF